MDREYKRRDREERGRLWGSNGEDRVVKVSL